MKKKLYLFVTLITITVILLTIGYSAFTNSLSITNSVAHIRADKLLRVTSVTTNSSYVSNLDYGVSSITSDISLPAGASITYTVTVKNLGNVPVALSGVTFKNGNNTVSSLSSDISSSNYVKICNQNECTTNVSKTFDITITNNESSSLNLSLTSVLTFTEFYQINYNDGIGVNSLGEALDGTNYQYTFNNNIPTNVILEGNYTSYTYQNGILNIQNVTGNVTVYKAYNINYDNGILGTVKPGTNYEYEFTNLPPSHIILEGTCTSHTYNNNTINIVNVGSDITIYKAYTITYNDNLQGLVKANGNYTYTFTSDIPSSITINNGTYGSYTYTNNVLSIINVTGDLIVTGSTQTEPDGTPNNPYINNSSTYTYDNLQEGITSFPNAIGKPLVTADSTGKVTRFQFTETGTITSGNSVNTGVMAFDSSNTFTIHAVFTANLGNNYNPQKVMMAALASLGNNKYSGLVFVVYSKNRINLYEMENATMQTSAAYAGSSIRQFQLDNKYMAADNQYTIDITFTKSTNTMHIEVTPGDNKGNKASVDRTTSYLNDMSNNATITLGGNGVYSSKDLDTMTVTEFVVTKG